MWSRPYRAPPLPPPVASQRATPRAPQVPVWASPFGRPAALGRSERAPPLRRHPARPLRSRAGNRSRRVRKERRDRERGRIRAGTREKRARWSAWPGVSNRRPSSGAGRGEVGGACSSRGAAHLRAGCACGGFEPQTGAGGRVSRKAGLDCAGPSSLRPVYALGEPRSAHGSAARRPGLQGPRQAEQVESAVQGAAGMHHMNPSCFLLDTKRCALVFSRRVHYHPDAFILI